MYCTGCRPRSPLCKETEQKALIRKRDANKSSEINIPNVYNPEMLLQILLVNNLGKNDVTAQPTNWSLVLLNSSVRRKKKQFQLFRFGKNTKKLARQHVWNCLSLIIFFFGMGGSQWAWPCFLGRQPPYLIAEREKADDYVEKKTVGAFKDGFANVYSITTRPSSTSS